MGAQKISTKIPLIQDLELSFPIKHNSIKRAFDIFFSLFVLLVGFPIFFFIGLGIKLTSKGPVFYTHDRMGRGGKTFKCLKFRTMNYKADIMLNKILNENPTLHSEWKLFYKLKKDPRITFFGKFLRKTSLDELPQFLNVIKGDLSVVGPRPMVEEEIVKYYREKASKILSIRPGITGIWQVSGRNNISMEERVRMEEYYVDNHSFFRDLLLIFKTIPVMLFSKGAY